MENNKRTVTYGNHFCDNGCVITAGSDYKIIEPNGNTYFYRYRFSSSEESVTTIDSSDIKFESEKDWETIPLVVREAHFKVLFSNNTISEEERILFIYGTEEGNKILDDRWADSHLILSKDLTLNLIKKVGRFKTARRMRCSLVSKNRMVYVYSLDDKFEVTIHKNGDSFTYQIDDYNSSRVHSLEYGKRVRSFCNKLDIPWEIGSLVGHIESDTKALSVLEAVKSSRNTAPRSYRKDLLSGTTHRMIKAIIHIIGDDAWDAITEFDSKKLGRKKIVVLASYIAGIT